MKISTDARFHMMFFKDSREDLDLLEVPLLQHHVPLRFFRIKDFINEIIRFMIALPTLQANSSKKI